MPLPFIAPFGLHGASVAQVVALRRRADGAAVYNLAGRHTADQRPPD